MIPVLYDCLELATRRALLPSRFTRLVVWALASPLCPLMVLNTENAASVIETGRVSEVIVRSQNMLNNYFKLMWRLRKSASGMVTGHALGMHVEANENG